MIRKFLKLADKKMNCEQQNGILNAGAEKGLKSGQVPKAFISIIQKIKF